MPENASGEASDSCDANLKNIADSTLNQLYVEQGLSGREIAERFNTTRDKVRNQLLSRGILRPEQKKISKSELEDAYHVNGLSQSEVADKFDISKTSVYRHINHYGLKKTPEEWQRDRFGDSVSYRTNVRGYEVMTIPGGGEFAVHRLVAISEHGTEAVADSHVHHENTIPWDNRPENLSVLEPGSHAALHNDDNESLTNRINNATEEELRTALRDCGHIEAAENI
jgi:predicted DNA-binding protein YlxM (UPF0122 family)